MSHQRFTYDITRTVTFIAAVAIGACQHPAAPTAPGDVPGTASTRASWPNEPAGLRLVSEWGLDSSLPPLGDVPIPGSNGWRVVGGGATNSSRGWLQLATDSGGPASAPHVFDFVYPEGMVEGDAPSTVYRNNFSTRAMYVGFWWKTSAPFDRGPNGNKIAFMFNGGGDGGGQTYMTLHPDGRLHVLPEYPGDFRWRDPLSSAVVVTPGVWHLVEWYADLSDGTLRWWLDGSLQGGHRDVGNRHDFDMFQFSPTWGGNTGARKRQTDHYWFDHVRLSIR